MTKTLDQPARKFFIKDLQTCTEVNVSSSPSTAESNKLKEWQFKLKTKTIPFSITWIQGVIVKVLESHDSFFIDDGTGVGLVSGYGKIQFASMKPVNGDYVMVIGPLVKSGACPVVRAVKIQNLSNNVFLEAMWCLEVLDQLALEPT